MKIPVKFLSFADEREKEYIFGLANCSSFRSVSHALNYTFKPRFAYKLERDSSTIEITTREVRSTNLLSTRDNNYF